MEAIIGAAIVLVSFSVGWILATITSLKGK